MNKQRASASPKSTRHPDPLRATFPCEQVDPILRQVVAPLFVPPPLWTSCLTSLPPRPRTWHELTRPLDSKLPPLHETACVLTGVWDPAKHVTYVPPRINPIHREDGAPGTQPAGHPRGQVNSAAPSGPPPTAEPSTQRVNINPLHREHAAPGTQPAGHPRGQADSAALGAPPSSTEPSTQRGKINPIHREHAAPDTQPACHPRGQASSAALGGPPPSAAPSMERVNINPIHREHATPPPRQSGPLRNGNPRGNPAIAPRCGCKTRLGTACRAPSMRNGRCRMHGGASTGPRTPEGRARIGAAHTTHGGYTAESRAFRARMTGFLRRGRVLLTLVRANRDVDLRTLTRALDAADRRKGCINPIHREAGTASRPPNRAEPRSGDDWQWYDPARPGAREERDGGSSGHCKRCHSPPHLRL